MNNIFFIYDFISILSFIFCLLFFSNKNKAIKGNFLGILGIFISIFSKIFFFNLNILFFLSLIIIIISGYISIIYVKKINIINIPELITILHSFVGFSTVLISFNNVIYLYENKLFNNKIYLLEIFLSNIIGSITFSGSLLSFLILNNSRLLYFLYFLLNKNIFIINIIFLIFLFLFFIKIKIFLYSLLLYFLAFFSSFIIGLIFILKIKPSNVPIGLSILNSYSGWSASISGFILNNNILIFVGSLIGSSGLMLSYKMCNEINSSIFEIIFSIFIYDKKENKNINKNFNKKFIYNILKKNDIIKYIISSKSIIIVPGYGMAVSKSQYVISDIFFCLLNKYKKDIKFAIHPVSGRLPGHMNVLLSEVKIPYKYIFSAEKLKNDFKNTDLVLVIGANDIINPDAIENKNSPLYGMSVVKVWESKYVIIFKRNIVGSGYSKINNSIFYKKNIGLFLGDAKYNLLKIKKFI